LHVAAKRYLCTVEPDYQNQLSPTSLKSFYDQGGVMNEREKMEFECEPHFLAAVQLRRWDDMAKDPAAVPPQLESYVPLMAQLLAS
jgi:gamma-butyrobetaine dioxygenase